MSFPHGDARLDLTDVFAFPAPARPGKSILIMNVHPETTLSPAVPTTFEPFASEAIYEFKIDANDDAIAEIAYRVRFSPYKDGVQTATLRRVDGPDAAGTTDGGALIVTDAPVSLGHDARITEQSGHRFFAGWRSDPFFFDPLGAPVCDPERPVGPTQQDLHHLYRPEAG